jgi:hypothetical protein
VQRSGANKTTLKLEKTQPIHNNDIKSHTMKFSASLLVIVSLLGAASAQETSRALKSDKSSKAPKEGKAGKSSKAPKENKSSKVPKENKSTKGPKRLR